MQTASGTVGVIAEPRQFPFAMPTSQTRRFGVTLRNASGRWRNRLVFAPFPGMPRSQNFEVGMKSDRFELALVTQSKPLSEDL